MKKILFIANSILLISCVAPKKIGEIDKIYVYDSFQQRGYTTAGTYSHFDDMIEKKINKIEVSKEEFKQFNLLFKNIEPKTHFQTKFGGRLIFAEAWVNNKCIRIVIASDNLIVDLTNNGNYKIKDIIDKELLRDFINKRYHPVSPSNSKH
jgi:hypothetical protein